MQSHYTELWQQGAASRAYQAQLVSPSAIRLSHHVLGSGNFAVVSRATLRHGKHAGTVVAVKSLKSSDENVLVQFLLEARLLHAMQPHPHIVQQLAVQEQVLPVLLVMEYCELGDLRQFLRQDGLGKFAVDVSLAQMDMCRQVAGAVQYLHSHMCLHRDLAARNVLVTARGAGDVDSGGKLLSNCGVVLKLADVGLARVLRTESDYYRVSRHAG